MKINYIAIALLAALTMAACKQNAAEEADTTPVVVTAVAEEEPEAEPVELVPVLKKAKPAVTQAATPRTQAAAPKNTKGKAETIYVETDGAQGRVWGHVNMNGDKGTGTIHDWDENTWAVSVTRHGNELFAVDQNSRLYVFKLKQNKTQE